MSRHAQLALPWPRVSSSAAEDFVRAPENRMAADAVEAWPAWPHPVLLLHGPAGSGKSHLAALWSELSGASPFRPGAGEIALLGFRVLLEDVDRAGHDESEIFAVLNAARLGGGSVLVTSRRPAGEIGVATPDLASRLKAAASASIAPPGDALLAGVLTKLLADRQIGFDPRLLSPVLSRMERSLDAARRLAARIDEETLASGRAPTRRFVMQILDEMGAKTKDRRETDMDPT